MDNGQVRFLKSKTRRAALTFIRITSVYKINSSIEPAVFFLLSLPLCFSRFPYFRFRFFSASPRYILTLSRSLTLGSGL